MKTFSVKLFQKNSTKSIIAILLLSIFVCFLHFAFAAGEKKVAVLELVNKAGVTDDEAYALTDQVRVVASQTLPGSSFIVMTSENIQELLPPDMDLKKCTDAKCEVEMGRMLGADYIITGEIIRFGGKLQVNLRSHNSFTSHFVFGGNTMADDILGLKNELNGLSSKLMTRVLSHSGVSAPAQPGGGAVFVSPTQPATSGGAAEVRALAPTEQPPATATGPAGLYITSNPPGADVYLGNTKAGTTSPAFQKVNLQPGTNVRVTLKMGLYHDVSFDVALKPGVMKFEGVELKPAFGSLTIESEPSGAKVLIGGSEVGATPFSDPRYPSGDYLVSIEKEWYLPASDQMISVKDGETTKKMYTLSQDFGTLEVASNPSGAEVTLDGKKLGTTPGSWRVPPVKDGKVEVNLNRYRGKSFSITIDRNQTVKITAEQATLTAKVGSLQVYADPPEPGAKVLVDGKEVGTAPATVSDLIEGVHEVKVEAKKKAGTTTVNIAEGQTAVATVTLAASSAFSGGRLGAGGSVWTDFSSGLMWQVSPTGGKMYWAKAKSHCESLSLGGHRDWRLPSISELRSLIRDCPETQKDGACGITDSCLSHSLSGGCRSKICSGCYMRALSGPGQGGAFWPPEVSGEPYTYLSSSPIPDAKDYGEWGVSFNSGSVNGRVSDSIRTYPADLARCVRGPVSRH